MYQKFFIHSSIDEHLGCFHVLAIIKSAAVIHWGYMYLFWLWLPQGICLVVVLLDHMVVLLLIFEEISILFSTLAVSVYIPTKSARGFLFLHTLSNIYVFKQLYP